MPAQPDFTTTVGRRCLERLRTEKAIWLTTVAPDGTPQPNPVWFTWDGETVLVYSHRDAFRNRNLRRNPRVALSFDSRRQGACEEADERKVQSELAAERLCEHPCSFLVDG